MTASNSLARHWVIIPAAGLGSRMRQHIPKQYLSCAGKTILEHTLNRFLSNPAFQRICVALSDNDAYWNTLPVSHDSRIIVCQGGAERADTVLQALHCLKDLVAEHDWVWVHDAARPTLSEEEVAALFSALDKQQVGALLGLPVYDTVKRADDSGRVSGTVDRTGLWRAQTPQVFRYGDLLSAMTAAQDSRAVVTDEASAIERMGLQPALVLGKSDNIKVTRVEDLDQIEKILHREAQEMTFRLGSGFDVHAFEAGDHITLGGVRIPHEKALKAHSDGDVLLHALADALLGSLALGDIGKHFPDTDEQWKGADSRALLRAVNKLLSEDGWQVVNVDSTIIAQAPKMAPYIASMRANIAEDLGTDVAAVSVKATTTEKLGFAGRKEGIACQASVLVARRPAA